MKQEPLTAHSVAEAYLYLMATPCRSCGKGPLRADEPHRAVPQDGGAILSVSVRCGACDGVQSYAFGVGSAQAVADEATLFEVNPTPEPSHILDVGQWVMLYHLHVESARQEVDRAEARGMRLRAAQCLQEALKFYEDPHNDLPPPEALFCEATRERFREHPENFSRQRILSLLARLPRTTDNEGHNRQSPRRE